ncbi:hypothetical protein RRG08_010676 [Elysia crispata]|uniref:Uncharacterized protein n=1 Tax=Elysia crispata TaxID=231223 RepID=A0AAE0Z0Q7_9GAST|nr:hypothetical protein RRG08_010676 [Elysia crispata]
MDRSNKPHGFVQNYLDLEIWFNVLTCMSLHYESRNFLAIYDAFLISSTLATSDLRPKISPYQLMPSPGIFARTPVTSQYLRLCDGACFLDKAAGELTSQGSEDEEKKLKWVGGR